MVEIAKYISIELCNPSAAEKLTLEMIEAAEGLAMFPYLMATYVPQSPLKHEYKRLVVKNYIMFYWINESEKSVIIARVIYARRDFSNLLI